jgi:ABC-2 type transport system ATP-binding protein
VAVGARLLIVSEPEASASLLLRVLAGLARLDRGAFRLAGLSRADASRVGWARRIGYVGPETAIHAWLSPRETLELTARLAGYDPPERRRRVDSAIERYQLGTAFDRPLGRLSPSLAQRTALAAAMLTDPEVILLDEPLRSASPDERRQFLEVPGRRRTVLLASHLAVGEEGYVNEVALIRNGTLALHVPAPQLAAAGLRLSARGIAAFADMRRPPAAAAAG